MRLLRKSMAAITLSLFLSAGVAPTMAEADTVSTPTPVTEVVEGGGWLTGAICAGCLAVGLGIAMSGAAAILAAASIEGSTLAAIGCVAACVDVFTE